jgi:DNA invertase Pin-like site-specific DNA recombinase
VPITIKEDYMQTSNSDEHLGKKVGGYARVSTYEQAEKGTSIDEQKRIIIVECIQRGWQLVQIYCDEGVSGGMTDRQGLHDLQRDAKMGLFQTIMFTKSDRLARSIRDLSNLWHDWTEWGLEIICVEQPEINSNGIYGKMLRNLLGIFAEWERDIIIERTTSGRMARWRKVEAIMGTLPYGYEFDRNNRKIVLHPKKALICKRIFKMFLHQEFGAREIALRLSKASIPSPRGKKKWHFATIIKILKNPAYAGKSEFNVYKFQYTVSRNDIQYRRRTKEKKEMSKWITIEFPPIISQTSHRKILEKMNLKSTLFKPGNKCYGKLFLLENINVICGECGRKMTIHALRKKNQQNEYYTYYRCQRNKMSRKEIASQAHNNYRCDMRVDAHTLDNFVFWQVIELLSGIVSIARQGLTELSLQKIIERAQIQPAVHFIRNVSHTAEHPEFYRIASWEVTKCSENELKSIKNTPREYSKNSEDMKYYPDLAMRRCDKSDQFEIDYVKISSMQVIKQEPVNLSAEISCNMAGMTFEEKKRVIESIISPESGGKCVIRWATHSAISNGQEELPSLPNGRFTSGAFRNAPQIAQIVFYTDLSRIQTLVWGAGNDYISKPVE